MAGIFDALVRAAKGSKTTPKTKRAAQRLVAETSPDDAVGEIDMEIAGITKSPALGSPPKAKAATTLFDSPITPPVRPGISKLGGDSPQLPKSDEDDDGVPDKTEMPPPAKDLVRPALEGAPKDAKPIIGSDGSLIGWAEGSPRGEATMGLSEDLEKEAKDNAAQGTIMREAFMPKGQNAVSGVIPEPEPTAENAYRMSARQTARIPQSVAQARERAEKEDLEWGSKQHNLALQDLQFDPDAQAAAGLAPGQLGTIIRGARAGDAQAVDLLDIILGQGDTSNENIAELKDLLRSPGLSAKDRKAIISEINKIQSPAREHGYRNELEEKKRTAAADILDKKQAAAEEESRRRMEAAVANREDTQEFARSQQEARFQDTMRSDLVRDAMRSPTKMTDEQLELFGATLPSDLKDAVISQVKAIQAFRSDENDRKLGAAEIDRRIKLASLDKYEAGKEQDKEDSARDILKMVTDAYRQGLAGGVPLSDERLAYWADKLQSRLGFSSPDAVIDHIKSAGAPRMPDAKEKLENTTAAAQLGVLTNTATPQDYIVRHRAAIEKGDPMAIAAQQVRAELDKLDGESLSDEEFAALLAAYHGDYRAAILAVRGLISESTNQEGD